MTRPCPHSLCKEWGGQQGTGPALLWDRGPHKQSRVDHGVQLLTFALSLQCRWPGVPTSCGNATNPERMGSAGQCIFLRSVTGSHVSALRTLSVPTSICKLQPLWPSVRCGCGDSAFRRGGQQAGPGSHGSHPSTCSTRRLSLPSLRGLAPAPPDPPVVISFKRDHAPAQAR